MKKSKIIKKILECLIVSGLLLLEEQYIYAEDTSNVTSEDSKTYTGDLGNDFDSSKYADIYIDGDYSGFNNNSKDQPTVITDEKIDFLENIIDTSKFTHVLYVDVNYKESSNGTKFQPFKDVDDALKAASQNDLIVLGEGKHYLNTARINKKINIIGQGKNTELIFDAGYMHLDDSYMPTWCHYIYNNDANFYKMSISLKGRHSFSNYMPINKNVSFNNILFKDLYDSGYSIFFVDPEVKVKFNNCTFSKSYHNLFRNSCETHPNLQLNYTYVNPTFYGKANYTNNNSIIFSDNALLDNDYKIKDSELNKKVGVYTGKYAWK